MDVLGRSVVQEMAFIHSLILCTVSALVFGLAVAATYMFRNKYSKSLVVTLVLLPAIVQVVIMLVNGNIGAGVAVAGAFSLVRFRSIPGSAREIAYVFFAMAVGFITGMGFILYALVFLLIVGGAGLLLTCADFGQDGKNTRVLRIVIPENLDYEGLFDDVLAKYALRYDLDKVRTTNMGSLYELTYSIQLRSAAVPKAFIDELRCRNGNLNITVSREQRGAEEM